MKMKMLKQLAVLISTLMLAACITPSKDGSEPCEGEQCQTETEKPLLKGAFVSGHLGNYQDCPEDAYASPAPGADADSVSSEGACQDDTNCLPILNCDPAQATIQLSNSGDAAATGLQVDTLTLTTVSGEARATLPVERLIHTDTQEEFDGNIAIGESIQVRVEFQGPQNPWSLLQEDSSGDADRAAGGGGILEIEISADNHEDLTIISTEIYAVPSVDT